MLLISQTISTVCKSCTEVARSWQAGYQWSLSCSSGYVCSIEGSARWHCISLPPTQSWLIMLAGHADAESTRLPGPHQPIQLDHWVMSTSHAALPQLRTGVPLILDWTALDRLLQCSDLTGSGMGLRADRCPLQPPP